MNSDGHLCYLCSEIFEESGELQEHLLDEHEIKREAELDIDITDSIQSDLDEEVELYDPLPLLEDDDIEDEFLLDLTTKKYYPEDSASKTSQSKPASNPIQIHYNQIIRGQSQFNNNNVPKRMRRRKRKEQTEQWFQCDQCLFKTKTKSVLKNHQLTHTFDCIYCPFKTVIPDALTAHIKGVHFGYGTHETHQLQQHPQQDTLEHQQQSQQQLETEAQAGTDILEVVSGSKFLLLDYKDQTAVSQRENLQIDSSRFSYLNTPRQSVIINQEDSKLTQRAYNFLQSTLCSENPKTF